MVHLLNSAGVSASSSSLTGHQALMTPSRAEDILMSIVIRSNEEDFRRDYYDDGERGENSHFSKTAEASPQAQYKETSGRHSKKDLQR